MDTVAANPSPVEPERAASTRLAAGDAFDRHDVTLELADLSAGQLASLAALLLALDAAEAARREDAPAQASATGACGAARVSAAA